MYIMYFTDLFNNIIRDNFYLSRDTELCVNIYTYLHKHVQYLVIEKYDDAVEYRDKLINDWALDVTTDAHKQINNFSAFDIDNLKFILLNSNLLFRIHKMQNMIIQWE